MRQVICLFVYIGKNSRFTAFLDSNLHTRLAIVTKNELGLTFPPRNIPKTFRPDPSMFYLVVVVTNKQTDRQTNAGDSIIPRFRGDKDCMNLWKSGRGAFLRFFHGWILGLGLPHPPSFSGSRCSKNFFKAFWSARSALTMQSVFRSSSRTEKLRLLHVHHCITLEDCCIYCAIYYFWFSDFDVIKI